MATNNQAYQFHYDPPYPEELSGIEFERQTEEAINDLAAVSNEALEVAEAAYQQSEEAKRTADEALATSTEARDIASEATGTATEALEVATEADRIANEAQSTAETALDTAIRSENKADGAMQTADAAVVTANEASRTARDAKETADNAYMQSELTDERLDNLLLYVIDRQTDNADEFDEEGNYYINKGTLRNLPRPEKGFLTVRRNEEGDRLFQTFLSETNSFSATRTGLTVREGLGADTDEIEIITTAGMISLGFTTGAALLEMSVQGENLVSMASNPSDDIELVGQIVFTIDREEDFDIFIQGESAITIDEDEVTITNEFIYTDKGRLYLNEASVDENRLTLEFEYRWTEVENESLVWTNWSEAGGDQRVFYHHERNKRSDANHLQLNLEPALTFLLDGDLFNVKVNADTASTAEAVTVQVNDLPILPVYLATDGSRRLNTGDLTPNGIHVFQYVAATDMHSACFILLNPSTAPGYIAVAGQVSTCNYESAPELQVEELVLNEDSANVIGIRTGETLSISTEALPRHLSKTITLNCFADQDDTELTWPAELLWISETAGLHIPAYGRAVINIIFTNGLLLAQLIAIWEPAGVLLDMTFDANGGTGEPETCQHERGADFVIPMVVPSHDEFGGFEGWSLLGDSKRYLPGDVIEQVLKPLAFTAEWGEAEACMLYFRPDPDKQGATEPFHSLEVIKNTLVAIPELALPAHDPYDFMGWEVPGSADLLQTGDSLFIRGDTNLYGRLGFIDCLIRYDFAEGDYGPEGKIVKRMSAYTIPEKLPLRDNHQFDGWLEESSGVIYQPGVTIDAVPGDLTFVAQWSELCAITFDGNGGSIIVDEMVLERYTVEAVRDSNFIIPDLPFLRTGYALQGWSKTGDTSIMSAGTGITVADSMTLIARQSMSAPADWKITLDSNGGPNLNPLWFWEGERFTLPKLPEREGFVFICWKDAQTGVQFPAGEQFTVSRNMHFAAEWETLYIISFDTDGGMPEPETRLMRMGEGFTLPQAPAKDGFEFIAWRAEAGGGSHAPEQVLTVSGHMHFVADWRELDWYTLTFDSNGGDEIAAIKVREDKQVALPAPAERLGFRFSNWVDSESDEIYPANEAFQPEGDMHFIAEWADVFYIVSFDAKGGDFTPESVSVREGDLFTLPEAPEKEDHFFLGWKNSESGVSHLPEEEVEVIDDLHFIADWQERQIFTITFDGNGGEPAPEPLLIHEGNSFELPPGPEREGQVFAGWLESSSGGNHAPGELFTPLSDLHFTAQWREQKTYTITFDSNGGEPDFEAATVREGQPFAVPEGPAKAGEGFAGWLEPESGIVYQTGKTIDNISMNLILIAQWGKTVKVTYDPNRGTELIFNGETFNTYQDLAILNSNYTILDIEAVNPGYTHVGWSYDDAASVPHYQAGDGVELKSDMTLYAVWRT